jgi:ArsR family transcriptional regulator
MSKQGSTAMSVEGCCGPLAEAPLDPAQAMDLARAFKALGDPIRLRMVSLIASANEGELCVCELTGPFDVAGPTISHHLKVLREAGLIEGDRRGTWIYYRILPAALARLSSLLSVTGALASPASAVH